MTAIQPVSKAFIEVNGTTRGRRCGQGSLRTARRQLWQEIYGEGAPLVALHGGLMTIPEMMTLIGPLTKHRKVVAVELQGHGRSPDTCSP